MVSSTDFRPEAVDVIFTAVESDLTKELEPWFAKTTPTFSTASAFRYEEDTPLIIPGVNDQYAEQDPVLGGVKYVLVSHNTKMGAGKGAVLLAECVLERGLIG